VPRFYTCRRIDGDVAIVTGGYKGKGTDSGKPFDEYLRWTRARAPYFKRCASRRNNAPATGKLLE
jgi:hypothetical protein